MDWQHNPHQRACARLLVFSLCPLLAFSQQTGFQTSFLPAAAHPAVVSAATAVLSSIAEIEDLSYAGLVGRELAQDPTVNGIYSPNASDLMVQMAEEKFQTGRRYYQERNFERARTAFDSAIDLMLKGSESPTSQRAFERVREAMVDQINRYDLTGLGAAEADAVPGFDKAPLDDILQLTFPVDPRIKGKVETQLQNTSSVLPLVVNDAVLSYITYFSGRGHRTIENGLIRAGRYDAMISRIFTEEGIPPELIRMAQAESGFMPRAVSKAAAKGMWQFVKFRGNEYGLKQTPYTDDRLDPEKATKAAAHHLHDLYNEFHDWYLAMAAYNCGPGVIERAVERTGYADFWELRARKVIPGETVNYVPIILAMTIVSKNASEYGIYNLTPDPALVYDTISLTAPVNLGLISDMTDTPVSELQMLNPALLRGTAPEGYDLHVPAGMKTQISAALAAIPEAHRMNSRMHRVQEGESLASIAAKYKSTSSAIASANGIAGGELNAGDRLVIPAGYHEPAARVAAPAVAKAKSGKKAKTAVRVTAKSPSKVSTGRAVAKKTTSTIAQTRSRSRALSR